MTKETLSKEINCKANICRQISTDFQLELKVGDIYDNQGKAESWTIEGEFTVETLRKYNYAFFCNNVPCHKVDYENEEECEVLGCEDCEKEDEVLVPASTKMRITYVSTDLDAEEMGFYQVDLELI
ncbi:hypothetical protein [Anaerosinus massiliensis]|uniref:hypothetical protein n=1 Tax=Massilibacillus massiliensis TaxID=1806837 RepID=UPI000DA61C88|nr:hypothetical protein [Massilibacillus massiliensis]